MGFFNFSLYRIESRLMDEIDTFFKIKLEEYQ